MPTLYTLNGTFPLQNGNGIKNLENNQMWGWWGGGKGGHKTLISRRGVDFLGKGSKNLPGK